MDAQKHHHLEHLPSMMNSCKLSSQRVRSFWFSPENFLYSYPDSVAALQRFLPSNNEEAYSLDEFRMYEFKVRKCTRGRSHDWTECPFAHPGEKARRRDPRKFNYSGTGCPDLRKGSCKRGDACEFAHGVFECWLHPARYRTQPCKDGRSCRRRVCFFAHTPEQLRLLPGSQNFRYNILDSCTGCSFDGSPLRFPMNVAAFEGNVAKISSPTSGITSSLRQMDLNRDPQPRTKSCKSPIPMFDGSSSLQSRVANDPFSWGESGALRVESGKDVRAMIYARFGQEPSSMEDGKGNSNAAECPDLSWINELIM